MLSQDPLSRQATVSIWNNKEAYRTKDLPCTVNWSFMLRDGLLHMSTFMRSNDVWTGVAYDVPIFCRIQTAVAWALGAGVGTYHHFAQSMHLYERNLDDVFDLHEPKTDIEQPPFFDGIEDTGELGDRERWSYVVGQAFAASRGSEFCDVPFDWYADRLNGCVQYEHFCERCNYWLPQPEMFCARDVG